MAGVKFSSVLFLILILSVMAWFMQTLLLPRSAESQADTSDVSSEVVATSSAAG